MVISLIITTVYFVSQSGKKKKQTEIIKDGNTVQIPIEMVGPNGEPPGETGGP